MALENKIADSLIETEKQIIDFWGTYVTKTNRISDEVNKLSDFLLGYSDTLELKDKNFLFEKINPSMYIEIEKILERLKNLKETGKITNTKYSKLKRELTKTSIKILDFIKYVNESIVLIIILNENTKIEPLIENSFYSGVKTLTEETKSISSPNLYYTGMDERTLNETLEDNIQFLISMLHSELQRNLGFLRKNQKMIKKKVELFQNRIKNNLASASNWAFNQGILSKMKKLGIKKYKFSAILDSRTSEICKSLHGRIYLISEAVVGLNFPPMHHYCRSVIVPITDDLLLGEY